MSSERPVLAAVIPAVLAAIGLMASSAAHAAPAALPSLAEPSLSPDGREIAFASGGDIWTVSADGGQAQLLVSDPATESRPLWSPDGSKLAFLSTRSGVANIYVLTLATGELKRLTWSDTGEALDGWSRDGKWLYFTSSANDVSRQGDIFRVSAEGGTPLEVSRERYLNEFESAPSPDGQQIALMARGLSNQQWWRDGHSHIDETELWLKSVAGEGGYRRVLAGGAKHAWPMWSPDGGAIYYMSDESGAENLWRTSLKGGAPEQLTRFSKGRLLWPSIGYDGRSIVFERGFQIWKLDIASGKAEQVQIALRGAPASQGQRHLTESSFRGMALSPDGKKVAVLAHGEVFAASAKDGGTAQRITRSDGRESDLIWAPDSRRLAYVAERGLDSRLMQYDFATGAEQPLTQTTGQDGSPAWSPDGKSIAYVHAAKDLHVLSMVDGKPGKDTVIYSGAIGDDRFTPAWSPDGRWIAFVLTDHKSFRNVWVIPAEGGEARQISFLANGNTATQIAWSPDGKYVVFETSQRSEDSRLVRVDLLPHLPKYREDAFKELFKPADAPEKPATPPVPPSGAPSKADEAKPVAKGAPAADAPKPAKKSEPVRIVFEGIRERATLLPLGMPAEGALISPDGKTLVFSAHQGGQDNLYSYDMDELPKEPPAPQQITSNRRPKSDWAFTPDSKQIVYLEGGTVTTVTLEGKAAKPTAITAEMDVDFDVEKAVVFDEAWNALNRNFYDDKFHGQDWVGLRQSFLPYVLGARNTSELRRDINLMIGELNASHSGLNPGQGEVAPAVRVGDLGLRFEREPYEAGKGLVIREVIALGPAAIEGSIRPGEVLVAVNDRPVGAHTSLGALLTGEVGKKVVLTIGAAGDASKTRRVAVRPVSSATAAGLIYRQWVNDRRAYVEKISGGKLGYVHIPDMGDESLAQLYLDLDSQNQARRGVVIDVRNNNGGYVNGHALDVFTRRNYLVMTPRDRFALPSRQALGQRALGSPTVLVTNESSLSDAEDFTEGYRTLGVGKVVGQPTAGWIIFTGGEPLIDGSVVRLPVIRIQDTRGEDMEMHPRPVDVAVERPLGETETGHDAQLEAAVAELLKNPEVARP